jgi:hypothetical protein
MKKLDKNAKLSSGKSKESSTESKTKGKAASGAKSTKSRTSESKPTAAASKAAAERPAKADASRRAITAKASSQRPAAAPVKSKARTKSAGAHGISTTAEPNLEEFSISLIKPGEKTERLWRTKTFQQVPAQREFGFPDVAPELPGAYGQDKLVLMPKDPEYMFCYWELTPGLMEHKSLEKAPQGNYRETLKINWESKSLFEPNFTFIPVFFWARKWYFGVPQVGQRYQVELGWLSDSGHFISIISSNLSELPESWAATQKRLTEEGEVLAFTSRNTKIIGSSENLMVEDTRAFAPEWNLSSESFSSSSWSRGPGDEGASAVAAKPAPASSRAPAAKPAAKGKGKPSTPRARLEISGKVLPGTKVHVAGNAVKTDKEGNFKTDFPYDQDVLNLELTSKAGASRTFTYDLKELVLT